MKGTLYIYVDANPKIGTGHLIRCKEVFLELQKSNFKVVFLSKHSTKATFDKFNLPTFVQVNSKEEIHNLVLKQDFLLIDSDNEEWLNIECQSFFKRNKVRFGYFTIFDKSIA